MNLDTQTLNTAANTAASNAERFVETAAQRLRDAASSALDAIKPVIAPVLAFAIPLARRVNWQMVALGLVAGAAGYLIRSSVGSAAERKAKADNGKPATKPASLNRWENEGGMIATSVPDPDLKAAPLRP